MQTCISKHHCTMADSVQHNWQSDDDNGDDRSSVILCNSHNKSAQSTSVQSFHHFPNHNASMKLIHGLLKCANQKGTSVTFACNYLKFKICATHELLQNRIFIHVLNCTEKICTTEKCKRKK